MADTMSHAERSKMMSRIRGTDTGPERAVRSLLHRMGYRFTLGNRDLPGSPDIVLPRLGVVVFVHGCFWHRHAGCRQAYNPKTRVSFWRKKFAANVERDKRVAGQLRRLGWRVWTVWECEIRQIDKLRKRLDDLLRRAEIDQQ